MIKIELIWYSKCSTCKKARKYLEDNNYNFNLRDIIEETPTKDELKEYISLSNKNINNFFNTSGLIYRELKLKDKLNDMSTEEKLNLLVSNAKLIKRPILVCNNKVLVGFREKEWSELDENNKM